MDQKIDSVDFVQFGDPFKYVPTSVRWGPALSRRTSQNMRNFEIRNENPKERPDISVMQSFRWIFQEFFIKTTKKSLM